MEINPVVWGISAFDPTWVSKPNWKVYLSISYFGSWGSLLSFWSESDQTQMKCLFTLLNTFGVPFHSIGCPIGLGPAAQDGCLTTQKWSEKALSDRPWTPERLSPKGRMNPIICPWRSTYQPIKLSSTDYLVTFTRFRSRTRIVEKGHIFDFATIFTRITTRSCTGKNL